MIGEYDMKYWNENFFKRVKNKWNLLKIQNKIKLAILPVSLVAILTSGCQPQEVAVPQTNTPQVSSVSEIQNTSSPETVTTNLSEEVLDTLNQKISCLDSDIGTFSSYVHNLDVYYENSEYFQIEESLAKYAAMKEYDTDTSVFIKNGTIDESALKQQILKNNSQYLSSFSGSKYKELEDSDFDTIFKTVVKGLNLYLNEDIDLTQLDDKLANLKILSMSTSGSGMVTDDGIMAFNLNVIETRQQSYPNVDYLKITVLHEANHLIQVSSVKEREEEGYSRNLGVAYEWDDLALNPLFFSWYVEGAAEQLMLKDYDNSLEAPTYKNNVNAIETITLANILRDDVDEMTLSKLSLQSDLEKFFSVFHCQTEKDKIEVIKMMYAFEICINQPSDFSNFYKDMTGNNLSTYDYQDSLKASIAQTLTKQFYEGLAESVSNNSATLEDVFSMISSFETEMNRLTKYSNDYYYDANEGFIAMYQEIQEQFFTLLSNSLNLSVERIQELYNLYYHDNISNWTTTSLLGNDEITFVNGLLTSRSSNKTKTINELSFVKTK